MKNLLLVITLATLVASCKEDNKNSQNSSEQAPKITKDYFYADVEIQATQKDDIALYYTEDNTVNFTPENAVWTGIKGENAKETVALKLREDRFPTQIRFDFGINKAQDTVKVFGLKIGYQNREFTISGSEFFNYFINNETDFSARIDSKSGALLMVKTGAEFKTPYFYPTEELNKKIKEITLGKP